MHVVYVGLRVDPSTERLIEGVLSVRDEAPKAQMPPATRAKKTKRSNSFVHPKCDTKIVTRKGDSVWPMEPMPLTNPAARPNKSSGTASRTAIADMSTSAP